jgi:hypothetical protein
MWILKAYVVTLEQINKRLNVLYIYIYIDR